jgi:hypothetical protein
LICVEKFSEKFVENVITEKLVSVLFGLSSQAFYSPNSLLTALDLKIVSRLCVSNSDSNGVLLALSVRFIWSHPIIDTI